MQCRIGCGACCIAPSISSPLPLHPKGKPAAQRCLHLDADNLCSLFGHANRPTVCQNFQATLDVCGSHRDQALTLLTEWELLTAPTAKKLSVTCTRYDN